jgi:hypothetical protein
MGLAEAVHMPSCAPASVPVNHKRRVGETKRHTAMLELTVMGNPSPIVGPPMDPEEAPLINLVSPRHHRGFFPIGKRDPAPCPAMQVL